MITETERVHPKRNSYSRTAWGECAKERLMRGKIKSLFHNSWKYRESIVGYLKTISMVKHNCCAFGCSNSKEKKKQIIKYPELKEITFHVFSVDDVKKTFVSGMSEHERTKRWIAACRLSGLNVTRHTRICSAHFRGGLGPTKLHRIPAQKSSVFHLIYSLN